VKRAQLTTPVPESWRTALERVADRNGRTLAEELRAALETHFDAHGETYDEPQVIDGQLAIVEAEAA
jgi:hypothetical protein